MGAVNHTPLANEVTNGCKLTCSSQSMAFPMQPSGEVWFPQLSILPLQPDTVNPSYIDLHTLCVTHLHYHTHYLQQIGEKKA